jgi:hypothetical protein
MDQFRVHMHFLQIKQVIYIKNLFLFYFYLNFELTGLGLISWKTQGLRVNVPKTQGVPGEDGGLNPRKPRVSLDNMPREGVWLNVRRPIRTLGHRFDRCVYESPRH